MRQVLVDRAKARVRPTGGASSRVTFDEEHLDADAQADALLRLNEALEHVAKSAPRIARVVDSRFFGGLTEGETATALGVDVADVRRDWLKARMLLRRADAATSGADAATSGSEPGAAHPSATAAPGDWQRLEPALDALLDAPPDRRASLIARLSGGDDGLRSQLEELVAECERVSPLLERPATERFTALWTDPDHHERERVAASLAERYRVTRELGHGGMAVVYLAHDIRHNRDVAVKVVHPELAATLGRERFLREIEIAARLHHPHIVPLYDSGAVDGILYYVMPYEPGHSVRERLARDGPLPIADAIAILRDVCDALAYAHQQGIVHRDIKPDNVLLSGRHALVTDFGVARAVSTAAGATPITTTGVALGTPAYMAPEQIVADPNVDHRADLYAFGVLAYELLAGQPPFANGASHQVLSAHLALTPAPLSKHRPDVPAALDGLVMKCLAKDPAERWQHADDVLAQLDTLGARRPAASTRRVAAGVAGALLLTLAVASLLLVRDDEAVRLTIEKAARFTTDAGLELYPALSPDGRLVAYSAGSSARMRIFVRPLGGGRTWALSTDTSAVETHPQWSPDGQQILFLSRGGAAVAPSFGGRARQLTPQSADTPVRAATWSPDGAEVAIVRGDSVHVHSADGARSRFVARGREWHSCVWSPVGTWLACVEGNPRYAQPGAFFGNLGPSAIVLLETSSGRRVTVTDSGAVTTNQSPQWSADGAHLLFVSDRDGARDVFATAIGADGRSRDAPRRLTTGLNVHSFGVGAGHLTYAIYQEKANVWSVPIPERPPVTIDGAAPVTTGSQVVEIMRASNDGKWLYYDSNLHGNSDIFRIPLPGGEAERLTSEPSPEFAAAASPNGLEFAFHRFRGGQRVVVVQRLSGGDAAQLTATAAQECCPIWSPDGEALAISRFDSEGGIFVVRRDTTGRWSAPVQRLARGFLHAWSPDGKSIAVASGRTIRGTDHGERLELLGPDGGDPVTLYAVRDSTTDPSVGDPHWTPDGTGIYFKSHDALGRASIWHQPVTGGRPRLIVRFDDLARPSFRPNFTTDGKHFYFTINDRESDIWLAELTTR